MKKYESLLDLRQTEEAIVAIKHHFQRELARNLNLSRVSAPLFVMAGTGINDDLNGVEKPVAFGVKALNGTSAEIVQSLAKWKRMALADYGFEPQEGLYTDMNAIRPDETLDELHSVYVDQWDWELVVDPEDRTLEFLTATVGKIYTALRATERYLCEKYSSLRPGLPQTITFVHTAELERRFPDLTPREREDRICREHGAVFLIGIGAPLASGEPHDGRAPDYDDWSTETEHGRGLNGDIVVWSPVLERSFELSSMGIRVDVKTLTRQLEMTGTEDRKELAFHRALLEGRASPVGGGRHRAIEAVHVPAGQGPHRRSSVRSVARRHAGRNDEEQYPVLVISEPKGDAGQVRTRRQEPHVRA